MSDRVTPVDAAHEVNASQNSAHLSKLVLQISQVCNLACTYCITQHGRWGRHATPPLMSPEMVRLALVRFAASYPRISVVNLFGGEPTLNLPAIEAAGSTIGQLTEKGVLCSPPHLSMATNGTCASKRLIDLIRRYDVRFVVSLDGPPEINDRLRTTASGKGVYARIRENIQLLRRETGFPKGIAFTYTAWHLRCNRALWDMLCALRDDTGIAEFAVMPATDSPHTSGTWDPLLVDPDRYIDDYVDCIRNSLREMASQENPILIDGVRNILAMLVHREQYQPCPAATSYFTVSANGDIYPCQNLSEDITCRITSLTSDTFARDLQTSPIRERILAANLAAIERIGDLPGLPACRICPSDNLGETGSLTEYAPQRFRLYQAVDRVVKDFFLNVIVNGTETERRRFLATLAG